MPKEKVPTASDIIFFVVLLTTFCGNNYVLCGFIALTFVKANYYVLVVSSSDAITFVSTLRRLRTTVPVD